MATTKQILERARACVPAMARMSDADKAAALKSMAAALRDAANIKKILEANALDVEAARGKIGEVMIDRLSLSEQRILAMADGIDEVALLPDPVGQVLSSVDRPNGLHIQKVSVPLGVIGIIYESRPNVTSDAAALCFRSGNVCVLKSGKEASRTSFEIVDILRASVAAYGVENAVNILEDNTRAGASELMNATGLVDVLIPRGGAGLIRACVENSKVPCIQTGTGICHIYVDESADTGMALEIINNAKTSRPSVCNAEEVLLVNRKVAAEFLPKLRRKLVDDRAAAGQKPVELRLDPEAASVIEGTPAGPDDFDTEFLDYILAVKVVADVREACEHIAAHSTHHSEAIISADAANVEYFLKEVDSAAVYVNASTRFTDGGVFGLGCEIGISTQKMHARGPMGLGELTSYKYVVRGSGQIR